MIWLANLIIFIFKPSFSNICCMAGCVILLKYEVLAMMYFSKGKQTHLQPKVDICVPASRTRRHLTGRRMQGRKIFFAFILRPVVAWYSLPGQATARGIRLYGHPAAQYSYAEVPPGQGERLWQPPACHSSGGRPVHRVKHHI